MPDQITTKPFVSQAQAGWAFASGQPWARRWGKETGPYKKLPKRVKRKGAGLRLKASYTLDDLYTYAATAGTHYRQQTAEAIAARIPELVTLKGERLAPGVTRIRGDLCNVHGRWGSCSAAGYSSGGASKRVAPKQLPKGPKARGSGRRAGGGKGRAAPKPKKTEAERAAEQEQKRQAREAERARQQEANIQQTFDALDLPEDAADSLRRLASGEAVDDDGGLVKLGLAEQADDGSYRLTAAGRTVMHAAERGDLGMARDTMSRARDRAAQQAARQAKPKKGGGGGKRTKQPPQLPGSRGGRGGTSSRVPQRQAGAKLPKTPTAPKPDKPAREAPAKPDKPQLPAYLANAARDLSLGYSLGPSQLTALQRNGLAKQRKDGSWQLTGAGLRAAIAAGAEPAQIAQPPDPAPAPRRRTPPPRRPRPRRRPPTKRPPVRTKAHQGPHTGVMVALYPDAAARRALARAEGVSEDAADLHLTLCYLGKTTEQPLAENKQRLIDAVAGWATAHGKPLSGTVNGIGRFTTVEDDGTNAVYASPDVPGLAELRQSLIGAIEAAGFDYSQQHDFTPHITVGYVPQDAPTPPIQVDTPIAFDRVTLAWGDEHHETPLGVRTKAFAVFKDAAGADRWLARTTTAFEDRDDEVISAAALAGDVARTDGDGQYGPLRWWHLGRPNPLDQAAPWGPGVDLGWCDFSAMHGRTLLESGTFKSREIARAVAARADDLELSPGFFHAAHEPDRDGVFHSIRRFERSLVPGWAGRASNRYTGLVVEKAMDAKKLAALKELGVSDATMTALLAEVERAEKAAETNGVRYKEGAVDPFRAFLTDPPPEPAEPAAAATKDAPQAAPTPAAEVAPATEADPIAARFKALEDRIAAQDAEIARLKAPVPQDGAGDAMVEETMVEDDAAVELPADDAGDDSEMTWDELLQGFGAMLQPLTEKIDALATALDVVKAMGSHVEKFSTAMGAYTKTKDDAVAQQAQQVAALSAQVAELTGETPRQPGYRASEALDTIGLPPQVVAALKDGPPGTESEADLGPFADQLKHWFPHLAAQPGQQR